MILDAAPPTRAIEPPAEPIVLPTPAPPARRAPLPVVAAVVPIGAAVVMWLVTGSMIMLLFAALGPILAAATVVDGGLARRRERRRVGSEAAEAAARAADALRERHERERAARWAVQPDAGRLLQRPADVWRPADERGDALVLGAGDGVSAARVVGGGDDEDAAALRAMAGTLPAVPVAVPMRVGVCVVGARHLAMAVARALMLQLCLVHPPDRLRIAAGPAGEDWVPALPHRRAAPDAPRVAFTGPGESVPDDADAVIAVAAVGAPVPLRCAVVLTVTGADTARLEHGAHRRTLVVEAMSRRQARAAADAIVARAPAVTAEGPPPVRFAQLPHAASAGTRDALVACIGSEHDGVAHLDLVADGPHAVVAGVTGSGKSELLITWVLALCASRPPSEVCFLLADFKGGTAFDALAGLPHVTGVLTDLDAAGARRAMQSLRAELRRREAELVGAGARDIRDDGVRLPRLVIVVDEFAAVLTEHPELHAVFADVAARGRALGMHLILGTQRLTGVVRDALLANCPLRIGLRVTDPADSRAIVGTDAAALLPGEAAARGLAYVRRAADATPRLTRIALSSPDDVAGIAARSDAAAAPSAPWLPALPGRIPLERLAPSADGRRIVLGVADEPDRQRQPIAELVIGEDRGMVVVGGAGSGKSTVLDLLAAQTGSAVRISAELESAWDAVVALERDRGRLVLVDDLDALAAAFPPEYAAVFLERMERIVRGAGASGSTVVVTTQRPTGPVARIAEMLPLRAILPTASRLDHVTAGGEPGTWDPSGVAGRAVLAGRTVQFAMPPSEQASAAPARPHPPVWQPRPAVTAIVARPAGPCAAALAAALPATRVLTLEGLASGIPWEELCERPTVLVGDLDGWQRQWSLFCRVRSEHDVVVSTGCAADFRVLAGRREVPPYSVDHPTRAWLVPPIGEVSRVTLPGVAD